MLLTVRRGSCSGLRSSRVRRSSCRSSPCASTRRPEGCRSHPIDGPTKPPELQKRSRTTSIDLQLHAQPCSRHAPPQSLVDTESKHNYARADGGALAQYQYQTLTEDDFWVFMRATLKVDREVAYAKANLTANADVVSAFWTGNLTAMFRQRQQPTAGTDSFLQLISLPAAAHAEYGAPHTVAVRFDVSQTSKKIEIQLSWYGKTRTRLPEAHWLDFELVPPAAPLPSGQQPQPLAAAPAAAACRDSWVVSKLNSSFCATDVSLYGGTHVHAVSDEGGVSWTDQQTVRLRTKDAALVSLEYKTAFPFPVNTTVGRGPQAVYVNLANNFWTTNYPNWYPFISGDEDSTFRFELAFE